jgi:hypothetical protein
MGVRAEGEKLTATEAQSLKNAAKWPVGITKHRRQEESPADQKRNTGKEMREGAYCLGDHSLRKA